MPRLDKRLVDVEVRQQPRLVADLLPDDVRVLREPHRLAHAVTLFELGRQIARRALQNPARRVRSSSSAGEHGAMEGVGVSPAGALVDRRLLVVAFAATGAAARTAGKRTLTGGAGAGPEGGHAGDRRVARVCAKAPSRSAGTDRSARYGRRPAHNTRPANPADVSAGQNPSFDLTERLPVQRPRRQGYTRLKADQPFCTAGGGSIGAAPRSELRAASSASPTAASPLHEPIEAHECLLERFERRRVGEAHMALGVEDTKVIAGTTTTPASMSSRLTSSELSVRNGRNGRTRRTPPVASPARRSRAPAGRRRAGRAVPGRGAVVLHNRPDLGCESGQAPYELGPAERCRGSAPAW